MAKENDNEEQQQRKQIDIHGNPVDDGDDEDDETVLNEKGAVDRLREVTER